MSHGKGSLQQTPMARPQVPGQFSQHVGPIVASEFHQNTHFLDFRSISGLSLTRWVKSTDWSYKKHIVGCRHAIPLQAVLYKGFHSYWLRRIAEGRPTYLAGFKSLSEVVFCHAFFAQLREEGLDLDGRAASVLQQAGQNPMQTDRVTATGELAKKVTDFMVSLQPQATVDNASPEVYLLKEQVELLQHGFQPPSSGASTVSSAEAVPASDGVHEVAGSMALEYGTARHVEAVATSVDDTKKRFLVKQWTPCKNDKEVMAWIDKVTLNKASAGQHGVGLGYSHS